MIIVKGNGTLTVEFVRYSDYLIIIMGQVRVIQKRFIIIFDFISELHSLILSDGDA